MDDDSIITALRQTGLNARAPIDEPTMRGPYDTVYIDLKSGSSYDTEYENLKLLMEKAGFVIVPEFKDIEGALQTSKDSKVIDMNPANDKVSGGRKISFTYSYVGRDNEQGGKEGIKPDKWFNDIRTAYNEIHRNDPEFKPLEVVDKDKKLADPKKIVGVVTDYDDYEKKKEFFEAKYASPGVAKSSDGEIKVRGPIIMDVIKVSAAGEVHTKDVAFRKREDSQSLDDLLKTTVATIRPGEVQPTKKELAFAIKKVVVNDIDYFSDQNIDMAALP